MVHLTLAISDFMLMLLSAVLWTGAGFAAWGMLGLAGFGCIVWLLRRKRS